MDLQLAGRHALITGSTAGIGFAIARGLAAEGAHVPLTGRRQASVDAALARLRQSAPSAQAGQPPAGCPLRDPRFRPPCRPRSCSA